MINTHALMAGIERYVISGAIAGLRSVVWEDEFMPRTDGGIIYLPRPNAMMTPEELLLWRYYAEHELGHEDAVNALPHWKEVMMVEKAKPAHENDELLWKISNLLSDHIQEKNRVGNMVGRDDVLLNGRAAFLRKQEAEIKRALAYSGETEEGARMAGLFMWDTAERKKWNSAIRLFSDVGEKAKEVYELIRDKSGVDIASLKNERDVFEAAKKVRALFPKEDSKDKKEADKKSKPKKGRQVEWFPGEHDDDPDRERPEVDRSPGNYRPRKGTSVARAAGGVSRRTVGGTNSGHDGLVAEMLRKTNLPAKVRAFLMGMKRVKSTTGYRSGRLDTNRLGDVLRNRVDLFRRNEPVHVVNSAVYLLVDSSGSMSGQNYAQACAAAAMMADALQGIGCNIEIAGFTEFSCEDNELIHEIHSAFGTRYSRPAVLESMSRMCKNLSSNADGENILYAYSRLKVQKESRKVLIVLSDGDPSGSGPEGSTMSITGFTKQTIEFVEADKGVTIVGLGMAGHKPHAYYRNAIAVKSGEPLENTLLEIVKNAVLC